MEGSLFVTQADMGYLLLQEEGAQHMIMRAQSHLPPSLASKLMQVWDDGVSGLVMLSGEALAIHGEGLAKFKLARLGKAALIAPIKVKDQPIGVVVVVREAPNPFNERDQAMLEAVADYASISLVNARLFQALEIRAQRYQQMVDEDMSEAQLEAEWLAGLKRGLRAALAEVNQLAEQTKDRAVRAGLNTVNDDMLAILQMVTDREQAGAAEDD
jgi:GAF domain-containing protein